jgi:signal transduction histidine kinase
LLAAADAIVSLIQGIGVQLVGPNANWLLAPWQQGIIALLMVLLGGWLSTFSLPRVMTAAKVVIGFYILGIITVGLAGITWLVGGHHPQVSLNINQASFGSPHIVLYGVIILALLGVEVPLNMSAETKRPDASSIFLRWGALIVMLAYIIGTFGVMVVVPPGEASTTYSTLTAIGLVFGAPAAIAVALTFIAFFILVSILYNVTFARILFVSALDHRLPTSLAKVNHHHTPFLAIMVQSAIVIAVVLFTYFLGPLLYIGEGAVFSAKVYNVSQATTTIIWCISMIFLFIDLPVLLFRFRALLAKKPEQRIAPTWVLYLCSVMGGIASMLGIWTTISASWNSQLISDTNWTLYVGVCTLFSLVIGLIGSAYPRLLSNLNEQTATARENARMYTELRMAYAKMRELDHLKDAFLTTASHELRTPLTIVQGYLELLGEMDHIDAKTRGEFLNKARRACDELVLLQANIMDASRLQFEAASLNCSSIHLKEICTAVIDLFEPITLQERRQVIVTIPESIVVWADETRLKQVFRNLFANALRYSPQQTPISITAAIEKQEPSMVRVNLIDRGFGVPPAKQEEIFERFVRLERDMHGNTRGSGLGLAITRQLVEAMHGTIRVESSGVKGEGSTFSFTLPTTTTTNTL